MADISPDMLDPSAVGKAIYDYWISLLRTDKVEGAEDLAVWDSLDDTYKSDFVEACQVMVTEPLQKYVAEVDLESKLDQAFKEEAPKRGVPCYTCAGVLVRSNGDVCGNCYRSHVKR